MAISVICGRCHGTGKIHSNTLIKKEQKCPVCKGTGKQEIMRINEELHQ